MLHLKLGSHTACGMPALTGETTFEQTEVQCPGCLSVLRGKRDMRDTPRLTGKAQKEMEAAWKCERRGMEILAIVVAEWQSDPLSVQCFDLRIVEEAKSLIAQYNKVKCPY